MKRVLISAMGAILLSWTTVSAAYEPDTHSKLSDFAARESVLVKAPSAATGGTTVLQDLGLSTYSTQILPYAQDGQYVRSGPPNSENFKLDGEEQSLQNLFTAGAELEDEDDRALNHFYDPVNNQGLAIGFATPIWAQISSCNIGQAAPYEPYESSSIQCFSLQDATSYFRYALTDSDPDVRAKQFGDLFLTIGHVVHLVQDMAQPQHVRNDVHCDASVCEVLFDLFPTLKEHGPSLYEAFAMSQINSGRVSNLQGYPLVSLKTAKSDWTTGTAPGQRQGLADFTNLNFVSATTNFIVDNNGNFQAGSYQYPVQDVTKTINIAIDQLYDPPVVTINGTPQPLYTLPSQSEPTQIKNYCASQSNGCMVSFVDTTVNDYLNPTLSLEDPFASSYSIFNADLNDFNVCTIPGTVDGTALPGTCKLFSLNNVTYAVDANFLLPRAVGYSAGLINYFFRGKLGVKADPNNINNYIVSNLSSYELNGYLEFYYDDQYGNRYPIAASKTKVDLPGFTSASQGPSMQSIPFSPPAYPQSQSTGQYMLVFDGNIGTEPGIAGKQFADGFYLYKEEYRIYDGLVQIYTGSGVQVNEIDLGVMGNYDFMIAVNGGSLYATSAIPPVGASGTYTDEVVRDGKSIVLYSDGSYVDDIAVNDKNLYVAINLGGYESVDVYDLAGNPVTSFAPGVSFQTVQGIGANDDAVCITGLDENGNGQDILHLLSNGAEVPLRAAPDGFDRCAVTSDRVYVVRQLSNGDTGPINVDVYKNDGTPITSFPVDGEIYSLGIAATDTRVYLDIVDYNGTVTTQNPSGYEQGVAIYQRDAANDTFSLLRKIWISDDNGQVITRDVAVDMKAVIANGDH